MRKKLTAIGAAFALTLLSASTASALTIADSTFVGSVIDGIPSNPANEVNYINSLIVQGVGTTVPCSLALGESCIRSSNAGPYPVANLTGAFKTDDDDPLGSFIAGDFEYVLAKYGSAQSGGGMYIWYIGDLDGSQTLPQQFGISGPGISHISLYNATGTSVPDGGATAALLGVSLVGLGMLRRRINL